MKNRINKIHFTSDTHFGHRNIMKYANRAFNDVDHMDESLIASWNSVVDVDDEVYHLGDVALTDEKRTNKILNRLNGKIHLITGNHEKSVLRKEYNRDRFEWIRGIHELYVDDEDVKGKGQMFVLCHYSMRVWNKSHHGSIHLYGHSHDSLDSKGQEWGKSMDVGVDAANRLLNDYRPFSYREIVNIMKKRDLHEIDHHVAKR